MRINEMLYTTANSTYKGKLEIVPENIVQIGKRVGKNPEILVSHGTTKPSTVIEKSTIWRYLSFK